MDNAQLMACLDALSRADSCLTADADSLHRARLAMVIDFIRLDYGLPMPSTDGLCDTELAAL